MTLPPDRSNVPWHLPAFSRRRVIPLVGVGLFLYLWNALYYFPWTVDDAFISLRYAQNLVNGNGLVYNIGERIEGFSNFTWTLLAALLMRLHLPFLTLLKIVGIGAGLASVIFAALLTARLAPPRNRGLAVLLTVGFLSVNSPLAVWGAAGLETNLFALLLLGMCLRYEVEMTSPRQVPWSAVLFALAWMTRPEAPIYGLYFLLRRLGRNRKLEALDIRWLLVLAAMILPYEAFGYTYFGGLLPHTHLAKIGPWLWQRQPLITRYLRDQGWGLPVLFGLAAAGYLRRRRLPPAVWIPVLSGLIFLAYARVDWMPRFRFFVPFTWALACFVAVGLVNLLESIRAVRLAFILLVLLAAVAGTDYAFNQVWGGYTGKTGHPFVRAGRTWDWWRQVPANVTTRFWPMEDRAWKVMISMGPDGHVALRDIGFVGFLTMNPIWDEVGLITHSVAQFRRHTVHGARQLLVDDFFRAHVRMLFIPDQKNLAPVYRALKTDSRFRAAYRLEKTVHSAGFWQGLLQGYPDDRELWVHQEDLAPMDPARTDTILETRLRLLRRRFPEYIPRATKMVEEMRAVRSQEISRPGTGGNGLSTAAD